MASFKDRVKKKSQNRVLLIEDLREGGKVEEKEWSGDLWETEGLSFMRVLFSDQ